ncbi:hypothetical protein O1611_g8547 [Lasiodiplodia mahajangana]|uniref:Uncharacterized protein n=1 Tax=Lasiodiplodia mahajangana TaxID=1108764 RepID=A0ACC2JC66_9PEZI|nr:hypothetical protein O1611_g8547 [Lasiodiplodia mahajangana]
MAFLSLVQKLATHAGKVVVGGRGREFARRAGFSAKNIAASAAAVTYTNEEGRNWAGENMAKRLEASSDLKKGVELGFISEEVAASMPDAWREWAKEEDAFYCMLDGQIVCSK